ncbi:cyclodeaminase/cyclohydrolase family protein [Arthrobacter sp. AFG20]|uniref:cyclodeaminase/cyclohydrolase family protein n=1 Tax=Arthrobacter sp. AFG20 TaxID=1688671 RepID=UPI000C9DCFD8|nr:cyclodeaminase/cyclohydrolase family protein [Arthrobacter sp. AFG20]PNH78288.1 formiminotransferase-cyclodeaminase [Arthrobacter sp. AFG20]
MSDDSKAVTTQRSTVEDWTEALAQSVGSPGGGAGAGVMLAIAASLASMVAGYTEADGHQLTELADVHARVRSLREAALRLADKDASASQAFGAAFRLDPGPEREDAIHRASVDAAKASAVLGERAIDAIGDLEWLASNGNPALVADVVVAFGALRAAVTGARTNVSFDLAALTSAGRTLEQIRDEQPALWATVENLDAAVDRIDRLTAEVNHRSAPAGSGSQGATP